MLAALLAAVGCAASGSAAQAQASNIDTAQPTYLTSNLGTTVNPVFQGGVLKVDQANGSYAQSFTLAGSGANTLDQGGLSSTFTGTFSDAVNGVPGALSFVNSGVGGGVTLSGASSYSGTTTIGDGVNLLLSSNGSLDNSIVNLTGATAMFDVSGATAGPRISGLSGVVGSRVRLGAKGLTVNHVTATIFAGQISGSGASAFTKTGAGIQILSGVNTYTNPTSITGGVLALSGAGSIASSSSVDVGSGATLDISATTAGASVARLTGSGAVVLGGQILTLTGAANDTFSGVISGSGGLTIAAGSQTLTGVNTYSGQTTIASGATLSLSGAGSIAASSGVAVNGTFDISAAPVGATTGSLSGNGHVILGGETLTIAQGSGTFSGDIAGTGGLVVTGGTQVLSGVNTYTGGTTVAGGVLILSGGGTLGAANAPLTVTGGTLNLGGTSQTVGTFTMDGGVVTGGSLAASVFDVRGGTIDASLIGNGTLVQSGLGTTILSGANSYTGGTIVMSGVLTLAGSGTLGAATGPVNLMGGILDLGGTTQTTGVLTLDGGALIDSGGQGRLDAAAFDVRAGAIDGVLGGAADLTKSGSGAVVLSAVNTYTGATTITGGALALAGPGAIAASSRVDIAANARLDISGADAGASITRLSGAGAVLLGGRTLTLANASDTFSGVITGPGGLTIAGGHETLTGANSYSGATTIAGPATLSLAGTGGVAFSGVIANGTFDISATSAGASAVSLSGAGRVVLGGETLTLTNASGRFDGVISGAGGVTVQGGGEVLTGANSYAGGTRITNAAVGVTADAALGAAHGQVILDGGALVFFHDLSSARSIQVTAGGGAIRADGVTVGLSGPIALGGDLSFHGAGATEFTGVARGAGTLSITEGVFFHNGEVSAQGVIVGRAATLRGAGVITAPVIVSGTLAPGNSPGTLTVNGPVILQATATSVFDIDGAGTGAGAGNFSRLVINGASGQLTAGGVLVPRLRGITGSASNTFTPAIGQQFRVVSAAGGVAAGSSFSGLVQPEGLAAGTRFDALYVAQGLSLVATPAVYGDLSSAGLAQTANERAVGASLDASRPEAGIRITSDQAGVYYPLYSLSATEVSGGLDALSPDIYADSLMTARQAWGQGSTAVADQLAGRRGAPGVARSAASDVTVWGDAFGQATKFSGPGTDAQASIGGLIFGVDRAFGGGLIGLTFSIDDVRTTATGGDHAEGQMFQTSTYGGLHRGRGFVDWNADYLRMDQHITRAGGPFGTPAKGSDRLEGAGVQVNAGLDFVVRQWLVEPTVGLSKLHLWSTAANEAADSAMAEQIDGEGNDSLQTFTGVRLARAVRLTSDDIALQIRGFAGWSHELEDIQAEARGSLVKLGGPAFTVTSAPTGRDAVKLGASFSAQITPTVTAYGAYEADLARHRESQRVAVGVRALW